MKHTYTEEEKEKIAQMLFDFLREHNCFGGEHFAQDDESQIDSIDLEVNILPKKAIDSIDLEVNILRKRAIDSIDFMCELADIKDVTEEE